MMSVERQSTYDSTSAAGAMMRRVREPLLAGIMLVGLGTSSAQAIPDQVIMRPPLPFEQTSAGATIVVARSTGTAIHELRRLSGLSWDQLARLFGVTRRSVHFWASGKPMAANNEEHLQRLLAVLHRSDRGTAVANRAALLTASEDGGIPFDLLQTANYEQALSLLGAGEGRRAHPPRPSASTMAARAPRPPEELAEALHESTHPVSGPLLAAKVLDVARRK